MLQQLERRLLRFLLIRAQRQAGPSAAEQLELMSRRDLLTGLLNRVPFLDEVRRLRAAGTTGTLMLIDIDHFKLVNDKYGHAAGDEVIRAMADRIKATLPSNSVIARHGGDELIAFVPVPLERGAELASRCVAAARVPIALSDGHELHATISVGAASVPERVAIERLLDEADQALFAAKLAGRDRVQVFDDDTAGILAARRSLAATVVSLQERNQELLKRVELDALTGLRNRHALDQILETTCGGPEAHWHDCSVVFLDIDHFGDYNHHHGDSQGDQVLRTVAQAIRHIARKDDLVFRKGGEELLAVLPNTSRDDARAAAERMRQGVEALGIPHAGSRVAPVVTVTVGIAAATTGATVTVAQLMAQASDLAMQAKVSSQRNRVHAA